MADSCRIEPGGAVSSARTWRMIAALAEARPGGTAGGQEHGRGGGGRRCGRHAQRQRPALQAAGAGAAGEIALDRGVELVAVGVEDVGDIGSHWFPPIAMFRRRSARETRRRAATWVQLSSAAISL